MGARRILAGIGLIATVGLSSCKKTDAPDEPARTNGELLTPALLCKHLTEVFDSSPGDAESCADHFYSYRERMGDAKFTRIARCMQRATNEEALAPCAEMRNERGMRDPMDYNPEASMFLKKMSDSARTFYSSPVYTEVQGLNSAILPPQFPRPSVGPTPPKGIACSNPDDRYQPLDEYWSHPTWDALDFAIKDPHYFSYEYRVHEEDEAPGFTVLAYGDIDCDGEYSTFSLSGKVVDGEVVTDQNLTAINEME